MRRAREEGTVEDLLEGEDLNPFNGNLDEVTCNNNTCESHNNRMQ